MSKIFEITMLPANEGDCLWVSYGDADHPRHILIDGGRKKTYSTLKEKLDALPASQSEFELLVISHIDRDHIEGTLELLNDGDRKVTFKDIWFNGYDHLEGNDDFDSFGARQGEVLTTALLNQHLPWNKTFDQRSVEAPADGPAEAIELAGDLKLTLISPDRSKLEELICDWDDECEKAGLVPGTEARLDEIDGYDSFGLININKLAEEPFKDDGSAANGSSIAFILEYDGKRALFSGDAHVDRLITALTPLAEAEGGHFHLDAFKAPHHGSRKNISKELLDLIDCPRYLVSTNGSYFNHPSNIAMSRIIKYGGSAPELIFNYRTEENEVWDNAPWQNRHGYSTTYPDVDGTITVKL